jgi:hypothetical protein
MNLQCQWQNVCRRSAALFGALLLAGCATPPEPLPPPTAADRFKAGETIELLRVPTVRERVAAVADAQGRAHVLVASTKLREVWHLVVDARGVQARHLVRRDYSADAVDAAFDKEGRLHALTDSDAWVLEDGVWRADTAPWQDAGLKATATGFVPGAPDLVWTFHVDGSAIGSPGRVDWWGFGSYGGALIWPWPTHGKRAVIVARSVGSAAPWLAIEPAGKSDTLLISTGSDRHGNLYVLYEKPIGGNLLSSGSVCNFFGVRVGADSLHASPPLAAAASAASSAAGRVVAFAGRPVEPLERGGNCADGVHALSVDPDDGRVWFAQRRLLDGEHWRPTAPMPLASGWPGGISAGGAGSFHVLRLGRSPNEWIGGHLPVHYLRWTVDGGWAAPLQVGVADVDSYWGGYVWDAVAIAAAGPDRAFTVWPTPEGISGRWVERLP